MQTLNDRVKSGDIIPEHLLLIVGGVTAVSLGAVVLFAFVGLGPRETPEQLADRLVAESTGPRRTRRNWSDL